MIAVSFEGLSLNLSIHDLLLQFEDLLWGNKTLVSGWVVLFLYLIVHLRYYACEHFCVALVSFALCELLHDLLFF